MNPILRKLYDTLANGCTAWPEGNWHDCCNQHDVDWRTRCVGFWRSNRDLYG